MRGGSFGALPSCSIAEMPVRTYGNERCSWLQCPVRDFHTIYLRIPQVHPLELRNNCGLIEIADGPPEGENARSSRKGRRGLEPRYTWASLTARRGNPPVVLPLPATQEDGDPRVPLRGSPPLSIRTQPGHAGASAGSQIRASWSNFGKGSDPEACRAAE